MEFQDEDDISVVTVQDSDGSEDLRFPNFDIRLLPSVTNVDSEIKQAHTALNTAYGSIKTKLSKVEQENRELKMLLNRKKPPDPSNHTGMARNGDVRRERNGEVKRNTSHSEILRQKRPGLAEESQHKRHGSWAYFSDKPGDSREPYVQFIETQIENSEREKLRLQEELEQLRVRYTDNELQITKLKQEHSKQETMIQQLRLTVQERREECTRHQTENDELRKMNINLQQQLKRAVESYDWVCTTNKTLEDRLQHHVDTQTKRNPVTGHPSLSQGLHETLRLSVTDNTTTSSLQPVDKETTQEAELLLSSLHQSLNYIQEKNLQFSTLKKLALQQRAALKQLQQRLGASQKNPEDRHPSPSVTVQHPITCEDDLENILAHNQHEGNQNTTAVADPYNRPPSQSPEQNEAADQMTRHKLRFPSQNSEDDDWSGEARHRTPLLEEAPWAPVKGGHGLISRNPFLVAGESPPTGGEIRSDGVFEDMETEMQTAVNYCDSGDFTIHDSGESQTQVKCRLPSTHLANYDHRSTAAPPPQMPYPGWVHFHGNHQAQQQQQQQNIVPVINGIAYPPTALPPRQNSDRKHTTDTRPKMHQLGDTRLSHSQSETIGRVSPQASTRRQRHGSTDSGRNPLGEANNTLGDHKVTRPQPVGTPGHRQSVRQQDAGYPLLPTLPSVPNQSPLNPFRPNTQGNTPRPLNSIEHNLGRVTPPKNYAHSNTGARDVNINPERPVEKLPGCSSNVPPTQPLNNDPLLHELGSPKPVSHHNLSNTYLTVKLPPVENAEPSTTVPGDSVREGHRAEAQTCPVCSQLFPTTTEELQHDFERHVNDCLPESSPPPGVGEEEGGGGGGSPPSEKTCIMCDRRFPATDQVAYEAHVQSHFGEGEEETQFEVLQF